MGKVLVDVVLKDGEDSTSFSDSFSSNTNVELKNPMVSIPSLVVMRVEESYFDTFKDDSRCACCPYLHLVTSLRSFANSGGPASRKFSRSDSGTTLLAGLSSVVFSARPPRKIGNP